MKTYIGLLAFVILLLSSSCNKIDDKVVYVSKEDFSFEDQKNIGAKIKTGIKDFNSEFELLNNTEYSNLLNYLNQHLGAITNTNLIESLGVFNWDIHVVVDDDMKTIFTTPGGHLYIYTGLLKFLSNESELVAILAHEVNYADNEITLEKMVDEYGASGVSDILFDQGEVRIEDIALWLRALSYNAQEVLLADAFAVDLICPFNYPADGIQKVIEQSIEDEVELEWLNQRPSASNRVAEIESNASDCSDDDTPTGEVRYKEFIELLP